MESVQNSDVRQSVKKPNDSGFNFKTTVKPLKKGYKPLLNEKESIEAVDNIFGMVSVAVDSRWTLQPDESKELGERLGKVLSLFPVKIEDNNETLQKMFAILALVIGLIFICKVRASETIKGENDGFISKVVRQKNAGKESAS